MPSDWYLSCPAVSQIYSIITFPSTVISLLLKSAPIVGLKLSVKRECSNYYISDVLPTPESPIATTLTKHFFSPRLICGDGFSIESSFVAGGVDFDFFILLFKLVDICTNLRLKFGPCWLKYILLIKCP